MMPEWVVSAVIAGVSALGTVLALSRRAGRQEAELAARIDQAAKDAEAARTEATQALADARTGQEKCAASSGAKSDALSSRVQALELRSAVQDERLSRMGGDLQEIKATLADIRERLPLRPH